MNPTSVTPSLSVSNHWFVCPQARQEAKIRVFLFPYAGGSPATFFKWAFEFPGNLEAQIAHYPGRGSRRNEIPINQIIVLAERLSQAIQPLLDKPFAFFGHSLGGLVAFELTRQLRQQNLPQPEILFISACGAPHLLSPYPPIHKLPDAEFLDEVRRLNGIPAEVLQFPEAIKFLLPVLRADFEAIENYRFNSNEHRFTSPIFAFGGLADPIVSREFLEGWAFHTIARFDSLYFPGDHFFINNAKEAVLQSISKEMMPFPARSHESV